MSSLNPKVRLTVSGAVYFPGGFMHPISFREMFGQEMWEELLARPRIVTSYDIPEEEQCPNQTNN